VTIRILFLCEGTSDEGIALHIDRLAGERGLEVLTTTPDLGRLGHRVGKSIDDKLRAIAKLDGEYDLVVVHRDADNAGPEARYREIERGVRAASLAAPHAAVVPVRMTEAWLVLDEGPIRRVAGNPHGRAPLGLPAHNEAERKADPKTILRDALATASGATGRRLSIFNSRFPHHRRQLLEDLDPAGPVARLQSWRRFVESVAAGLEQAEDVAR
jgi:hypothetical protein